MPAVEIVSGFLPKVPSWSWKTRTRPTALDIEGSVIVPGLNNVLNMFTHVNDDSAIASNELVVF